MSKLQYTLCQKFNIYILQLRYVAICNFPVSTIIQTLIMILVSILINRNMAIMMFPILERLLLLITDSPT